MTIQGKTVLTFGATGSQGGIVARELDRRGATVLGVSRKGASSPVGRAVAGDLLGDGADAARSLAAGADLAFFHLPISFGAPGDGARVRRVVDALVAGGVRRVVFSTSGPLPEAPIGVPFIDEKVGVAQHVLASGRGVVIRSTAFMENLSAPWSAPRVLAGELLYPLATATRVAWTTSRDVAVAVAAAFERDHAVGRSFTVAGPEVLDFAGVAAQLSEALGRRIVHRAITGAEYAALLAPFTGPEVAGAIGGFYDATPPGDNPALLASGAEAAAALGLTPTSLLRWARDERWA